MSDKNLESESRALVHALGSPLQTLELALKRLTEVLTSNDREIDRDRALELLKRASNSVSKMQTAHSRLNEYLIQNNSGESR